MDFGDVLLIVSLSFLKFSLTQFLIFLAPVSQETISEICLN